jgi:pimeloyl-ACP methyl ester carboxylesterase
MAGMSTTADHFTVHHDGVTIPVSRGGRGRPLVLCPGLLTTQADLRDLTELLRRDHDVVTFDLRGHGRTSAGNQYTFTAFLGDFTAVMAELARRGLPAPPVLVGHSLGADLIVRYAAEHPGTGAGLVLIDGANPVPEPFVTEAELPEFRAMAEDLRHQAEHARGTPRQVLLTAREILDLNLQVEDVRSGILDSHRAIHQPTSMIMSTFMAGNGDDERTLWRNRNWRAGVERLLRERPHIATSWLDAGHRSVITHAADIARIIRRTHGTADGPAASPPARTRRD